MKTKLILCTLFFLFPLSLLAGVVDIAGILRCNPSTGVWSILSNSGHMPLHLNSVSSTATQIYVGWDFTADKVISLTISPDETLAPLGVVGGATVGFDTAYFTFNMPVADLCISSSGNFFVNGKMWVN